MIKTLRATLTLTPPIRLFVVRPALRTLACFIYYLAIIIMLLWIYGRGDTPTAPFVYQGF